jgi:hypothetical protein
MAPGNFNLNVYLGDSYNWQFQLWQDAAMTLPVDLTGTTAKAQIRKSAGATGPIEMTCTVTLPNTVVVALSAAQSATCFNGVWDLELDGPSGAVTTVVAGTVTVTPDVTEEGKP